MTTCLSRGGIVLALLLELVATNGASAQESGAADEEWGRLLGRLHDAGTGWPVAGALVALDSLHLRAITNERGEFRFGAVPPGTHELTIRHIGYGVRVWEAEVKRRSSTLLEIELAPRAIELEPLAIRVEGRIRPLHLERVGFYEREEAGWGFFLDAEYMERWTRALTRFDPKGFFRTHALWDPYRVAARRRGCRGPVVYVDGRRDRSGLIASLSAPEIGAVEVYRDTQGTPVWALDSEARCGVIAVWLKRW